MSDKIFMKEITLPIVETGENETYSFVQTDADLDTAGDAADAKKTGDEISSLKQDLIQLDADKADITADNPEMGAGYAGQLVSSHKTADNAPYIFRKTPYDSTLEYGDIVGASVAWNQLAPAISSLSVASGTKSVSDDVMTYTRATATVVPQIYWSASFAASHVFFATINLKPIKSVNASFRCSPHGHVALNANLTANAWNNLATVTKLVNASTEASFYIDNDFVLVEGDTVQAKNIMFIDLTLLLGTTIADYVYSLETATAGSGIAWLRSYGFFNKPYYPYSAPTLKSVSGLSAKVTRGFNQFNGSQYTLYTAYLHATESGYSWSQTNDSRSVVVRCLPSTEYCVSMNGLEPSIFRIGDVASDTLPQTPTSGGWDVPLTKPFSQSTNGKIVYTTSANARYLVVQVGSSYVDNHSIDTNLCINFSKPTGTPKNGDYLPYEAHVNTLDPDVTLRGILKLDSNNEIYADGDVYSADGTVKEKFEEIDLGAQTWTYSNGTFYSQNTFPVNYNTNYCQIMCAKYLPVYVATSADMNNGEVRCYSNRLYIKDSNYTDAATFTTAMNGVKLIYEKQTPTTETADPFQSPQLCNPDGTEQFVFDADAFEMPVGHYSEYPLNVSGQLDEILDAPSTDGTYVLQATVSSGAVTYEWVSA